MSLACRICGIPYYRAALGIRGGVLATGTAFKELHFKVESSV